MIKIYKKKITVNKMKKLIKLSDIHYIVVDESELDMFTKHGVKSILKGNTEIKLVKPKKKKNEKA